MLALVPIWLPNARYLSRAVFCFYSLTFAILLPEEAFLKAGLEVHGFLGFELKFYVTVDRIVVPHIRLIQLEIIELNIGQSNLSTFEN